ncbi:MAG: GDSL-type esterase/lipase family protein [Bacillota bacterium]
MSLPKKNKSEKKSPWLFYLIMVLIPVIFFVLLEAGLRIFNYGIDTTQWVAATSKKLVLNPEIAHRYFYTTKSIPYSNQEIFDKVKSDNSFRIFVLGESSAAGYPYLPVGSFSRFLQKRLELLYPEMKIEVINISMTAINTYALRDMLPGVLEQKPDLILIYTGHNEFYGALGVGSNESLGSSPAIVNLILKLNKLKTVELLRNFLGYVAKAFKSNTESGGTLMSRIVKDQTITLGSSAYKAGLNQFSSNMRDILQMAKDNNVPVVLGTLTSNLKDQAPFISVKAADYPEASDVFKKAGSEFNSGNRENAEKLFRQAKDLDALRFRASEDINNIIRQLANDFNCPVAEIDQAFNQASPGGIVGNNLMTDHLHPTLKGYELMGKLFYETMKKSSLLPKKTMRQFNENELDKLTQQNFKFSKLDSIIAYYRILALKNDWPFTDPKHKRPDSQIINPRNFIDSLAANFFYSGIDWEAAHIKAANWYLARKDYKNFKEQIDVLISQFPVITRYYDMAINVFLDAGNFDEAYNYLLGRYELRPDGFSSKWLGIINLSKQRTDEALSYLKTSLQYDSRDAQVLFNLAGVYVYKKDYSKALEIIDQCLQIDPGFPDALRLKSDLIKAIEQEKRKTDGK